MEIIYIDIDLRVLMDVNVIVYRIWKSWSWQKTKATVDQRVRRGTATLTPKTPSTSVRWSGSPWMGSTGRETLIGVDKSRVVLHNQCHWWMPARHTHCILILYIHVGQNNHGHDGRKTWIGRKTFKTVVDVLIHL